VLLVLFCACKTNIKRGVWKKSIQRSSVFSKSFTGFFLFDPQQNKVVYSYNGDKYFTPASNTKLFTFYTALRILGDSVPALQYYIQQDSLFFWGTGDPAMLHPDLKNTKAYDFLSNFSGKLFYVPNQQKVSHFGRGWAWDDFNDYYSSEKSVFPMYGNNIRFSGTAKSPLNIQPPSFKLSVITDSSLYNKENRIQREVSTNIFTYFPPSSNTGWIQDVPYIQSPELTVKLLRDTLHRNIGLLHTANHLLPNQTLYSIHTDSLYKRFLQESDNFIAEQLLIICASVLFDSISTEKIIQFSTDSLLKDLPDKPVWVDGSGLSRYNLFTPRTIVALLNKIYQQVPRDRLFQLLPIGGKAGTIKNWYKAKTPFIYAKTGTLSHVHCLSGYLLTKKGKVLIFSFMHNNFTVSVSAIRKEMDKVLRSIYEKN
jgi:D-alanyl-D-alanine carboxypeptidase/D-alanyl-D-alanine-endopeptidase (penicillin-binding protein 4)